MDLPLVDVVVITYNHKKFIAQTIESVLMQKTTFRYRIIIGDDCSSDGAQAIIREYAHANPDVIETILLSENIGIHSRNSVTIQCLRRCEANYIALLEGDDYWVDPYKLQKQVDFMQANPECTLVFHPVQVISGIDNEVISFHSHDSSGGYIKKDTPNHYVKKETLILNGGSFVSTPSMLFRGDILRNLPEWYFTAHAGDYALVLWALARGDVYFINDVMAAYRRGVQGSAVSQNKELPFEDKFWIYKNLVSTLLEFNTYTKSRFETPVKERLSNVLYGFLVSYSHAERRHRLKAYTVFGRHIKFPQRKEIWLGLFPCFKPVFSFFGLIKGKAGNLSRFIKF
jgi:glycosyltransferase involved in cell wall biosynthesis